MTLASWEFPKNFSFLAGKVILPKRTTVPGQLSLEDYYSSDESSDIEDDSTQEIMIYTERSVAVPTDLPGDMVNLEHIADAVPPSKLFNDTNAVLLSDDSAPTIERLEGSEAATLPNDTAPSVGPPDRSDAVILSDDTVPTNDQLEEAENSPPFYSSIEVKPKVTLPPQGSPTFAVNGSTPGINATKVGDVYLEDKIELAPGEQSNVVPERLTPSGSVEETPAKSRVRSLRSGKRSLQTVKAGNSTITTSKPLHEAESSDTPVRVGRSGMTRKPRVSAIGPRPVHIQEPRDRKSILTSTRLEQTISSDATSVLRLSGAESTEPQPEQSEAVTENVESFDASLKDMNKNYEERAETITVDRNEIEAEFYPSIGEKIKMGRSRTLKTTTLNRSKLAEILDRTRLSKHRTTPNRTRTVGKGKSPETNKVDQAVTPNESEPTDETQILNKPALADRTVTLDNHRILNRTKTGSRRGKVQESELLDNTNFPRATNPPIGKKSIDRPINQTYTQSSPDQVVPHPTDHEQTVPSNKVMSRENRQTKSERTVKKRGRPSHQMSRRSKEMVTQESLSPSALTSQYTQGSTTNTETSKRRWRKKLIETSAVMMENSSSTDNASLTVQTSADNEPVNGNDSSISGVIEQDEISVVDGQRNSNIHESPDSLQISDEPDMPPKKRRSTRQSKANHTYVSKAAEKGETFILSDKPDSDIQENASRLQNQSELQNSTLTDEQVLPRRRRSARRLQADNSVSSGVEDSTVLKDSQDVGLQRDASHQQDHSEVQNSTITEEQVLPRKRRSTRRLQADNSVSSGVEDSTVLKDSQDVGLQQDASNQQDHSEVQNSTITEEQVLPRKRRSAWRLQADNSVSSGVGKKDITPDASSVQQDASYLPDHLELQNSSMVDEQYVLPRKRRSARRMQTEKFARAKLNYSDSDVHPVYSAEESALVVDGGVDTTEATYEDSTVHSSEVSDQPMDSFEPQSTNITLTMKSRCRSPDEIVQETDEPETFKKKQTSRRKSVTFSHHNAIKSPDEADLSGVENLEGDEPQQANIVDADDDDECQSIDETPTVRETRSRHIDNDSDSADNNAPDNCSESDGETSSVSSGSSFTMSGNKRRKHSVQHYTEVTTSKTPAPTRRNRSLGGRKLLPETPKLISPKHSTLNRRSQRKTCKPLNWWTGQRIEYVYDPKTATMKAKGLIRGGSDFITDFLKSKKAAPKVKKVKTAAEKKAVRLSVHVPSEEIEDLSDSEDEVYAYEAGKKVKKCLISSGKNSEYFDLKGNICDSNADVPVKITKSYQDSQWSSGKMILGPLAHKPQAFLRGHSASFTVIEGVIMLQLQHNKRMLKKGAIFSIPEGNSYSLRNLRQDAAEVTFTTCVVPRTPDDESESGEEGSGLESSSDEN